MRTRTFKTKKVSLLFLAFEVLVQTRLSVRALMQCQSGSDPLPVPFQMYGSVAFMAIRKAETGAGKAAKACSKASPEGVLAMPKSEAMALDLKTIMENHNDGEIWIGLKKADDDEDECFNAGCNSILQWKDGSSFEYHSWMGHLSVDEDDKCFRLSYGSNIISGSCNQWIEGHICQFNCPGEIVEVNATCPLGEPIPKDFQPQGNNWYKILQNTEGSKAEAQQACSAIGGQLPTITDEESFDALTEILKFANGETWLNMNPITVECQNEACNSNQSWSNGQPFFYSHDWYEFVNFQIADCATIRNFESDFNVVTKSCLSNSSIICEFACQPPIETNTTTTTTTTTTNTTTTTTTTTATAATSTTTLISPGTTPTDPSLPANNDYDPPEVVTWTGLVPNDVNRDVACQRECAKDNPLGYKSFGKIKDPFEKDLSPVLWPCLCMRSKIMRAPGFFCGPQNNICT